MRTHGRPLAASAGKRDDVVLDDDVGRELVDDLEQALVDVLRAVDRAPANVGAMNSPSCSIVGLRKTGAVSRMKSIQNWPGTSSLLGRRAEAHQPLLEALRLERPGERLLDDEDDPVAARAQHLRRCPTQLLVGP